MFVAKISDARRRANEKYNAKAYDEIKVRVPKNKKKDIKAHAESLGESLNAFINRAIDNTIAQDNNEIDLNTKGKN